MKNESLISSTAIIDNCPIKQPTIVIAVNGEDTRSRAECGNIKIYLDVRYSWFRKMMYKICFGFELKRNKESKMGKYWKHFKTICKHKWYVMKYCFKCGFYWRGLTHDLSKFGITEFFSSAKYFQGTRSPIDAEKEKRGYSLAWQHHKGHNPHHWEYWIDNVGTKENTAIRIPYQYVIEMICDWLGAGIVYSGHKVKDNEPYREPLEFYNKKKGERIFHPETQKLIEDCLEMIAEESIGVFCEWANLGEEASEYDEE